MWVSEISTLPCFSMFGSSMCLWCNSFAKFLNSTIFFNKGSHIQQLLLLSLYRFFILCFFFSCLCVIFSHRRVVLVGFFIFDYGCLGFCIFCLESCLQNIVGVKPLLEGQALSLEIVVRMRICLLIHPFNVLTS